MEFFNKKQDVIDIKLTQFGRFLLSKGMWKPEFYSFHDDNIVYNSTAVGVVEDQHETQPRIRSTPTLKTQVSFDSLDKDYQNTYEHSLTGQAQQDIQPDIVKNYALPQPIGTSDINKDNAPALQVRYLNGSLTGSVNMLSLTSKSGGRNTLQIPQLETNIEIEYSNIEEGTDFYENETGQMDIAITSVEDDLYVLLKVEEANAPFQRENFDIEVFEIEKNDDNGTVVETLRPLSFISKNKNPTPFGWIDNPPPPEPDSTYVEHYFELLVDEEIDPLLLCNKDPIPQKQGVFADKRARICRDLLNDEGRVSFDIYEDEVDDPGEVC